MNLEIHYLFIYLFPPAIYQQHRVVSEPLRVEGVYLAVVPLKIQD